MVRQKTSVHFMEDHYFSLHGVTRLSLCGWKEMVSMHACSPRKLSPCLTCQMHVFWIQALYVFGKQWELSRTNTERHEHGVGVPRKSRLSQQRLSTIIQSKPSCHIYYAFQLWNCLEGFTSKPCLENDHLEHGNARRCAAIPDKCWEAPNDGFVHQDQSAHVWQDEFHNEPPPLIEIRNICMVNHESRHPPSSMWLLLQAKIFDVWRMII